MDKNEVQQANPSTGASNLFRLWTEIIFHPKEALKREKSNASFKKVLLNLFIAGLLWGLSTAVLARLFMQAIGGFLIDAYPGFLLLFAIIIGTISFVVEALIFSGIVFLIARAFKGRGNFITQTYLISIIAIPLSIVSVSIELIFWPLSLQSGGLNSLSVISFIPFWTINLIILVYGLYLLISALKETHK